MLGVKIERGVHRAHPQRRRRLAVQQMQEVSADRVVVGFDLDALAVVAPVIPVEQHRSERGHQPVGDVARTGDAVIVPLGKHRAQRRNRRAHDVHGMRCCGDELEDLAHRLRDATQSPQLGLVRGELGPGRKLAVHEQVRDFLEFAGVGDVENVVAAVVQIVARAADRAKCGVPGNDSG